MSLVFLVLKSEFLFLTTCEEMSIFVFCWKNVNNYKPFGNGFGNIYQIPLKLLLGPRNPTHAKEITEKTEEKLLPKLLIIALFIIKKAKRSLNR